MIQLQAQKTAPPMKVSLIFALEPVFAAIFAWTVGGEKCSALSIAGGTLIFLGILVSQSGIFSKPKIMVEERIPDKICQGES
jgi:drug/metabolite transporter (DMT)-like permease